MLAEVKPRWSLGELQVIFLGKAHQSFETLFMSYVSQSKPTFLMWFNSVCELSTVCLCFDTLIYPISMKLIYSQVSRDILRYLAQSTIHQIKCFPDVAVDLVS